MARISILVVDDHTMFRDSLRHLFASTSDIEVVADAETGEQALELLKGAQPDVILMDYELATGKMDGIETLKQIHAECPDLPVLMLSMYDERPLILGAARAGAAGYVVKAAPAEELIQAVRLAADGRSWLSPAAAHGLLASLADGEVDSEADSVGRYGITKQEREILQRVASGLTYEQISKEIFLSVSRIKTLMGGVCEKLGARGQTHATAIAIAEGIIALPDASSRS